MKLPRREFLYLAAGAAALSAASRITWAQAYPTRPVRIIVGFPGGIAVGGRPYDDFGANIAARARPVLDNELPTEPLRQRLTGDPRDDVGRLGVPWPTPA